MTTPMESRCDMRKNHDGHADAVQGRYAGEIRHQPGRCRVECAVPVTEREIGDELPVNAVRIRLEIEFADELKRCHEIVHGLKCGHPWLLVMDTNGSPLSRPSSAVTTTCKHSAQHLQPASTDALGWQSIKTTAWGWRSNLPNPKQDYPRGITRFGIQNGGDGGS